MMPCSLPEPPSIQNITAVWKGGLDTLRRVQLDFALTPPALPANMSELLPAGGTPTQCDQHTTRSSVSCRLAGFWDYHVFGDSQSDGVNIDTDVPARKGVRALAGLHPA